MSRRFPLDSGETAVIAVTPVARGLLGPLAVLVTVEALVVWAGPRWATLHRHEALAMFALGLLPTLVLATRSWRWRSHKIVLTSQRVVIQGGVLARFSTQVNLGDVAATHADQSFAERLRRRGVVILETPAGSVTLGPVRHPAALRRRVDRTRRDGAVSSSRSWEEWFEHPDAERE